jgi:uncharacterized protein YbjT (DUF2867 family)
VRGLARTTSSAAKVAELEKLGVEIVRGDLKDRGSLDAACAGAEVVISTVSIITTAQAGDSFDATDSAGTMALIDAAKQAGASKFVFVSFDTTKTPDNPLSSAKRSTEEHLKASGLDYTILHSTLFCESWLGPMLFADPVACTAKVYGKGTEKLRYVAVADVAEFAVQSLTNPAARNATIPIGGPEEISQRDAVRLFEEAFGRKFSVIEIPEAALEAQWSAAQNPFDKTFAGPMLGVARGFDSGIKPPFDQFPMETTSPREYIREQARASGRSPGTAHREVTSNGAAERRAEL